MLQLKNKNWGWFALSSCVSAQNLVLVICEGNNQHFIFSYGILKLSELLFWKKTNCLINTRQDTVTSHCKLIATFDSFKRVLLTYGKFWLSRKNCDTMSVCSYYFAEDTLNVRNFLKSLILHLKKKSYSTLIQSRCDLQCGSHCSRYCIVDTFPGA